MVKKEKHNHPEAYNEDMIQRADDPLLEEDIPERETLTYKILYEGTLPRDPHGNWNSNILHRCTTALIYCMKNEEIDKSSTILTDPGWTDNDEELKIINGLEKIDLSFEDIEYVFITHAHNDHICGIMNCSAIENAKILMKDSEIMNRFPLEIFSTPGHSPDSRTLCFQCDKKYTAVVGDAVINEDYLINQEIYRPNGYTGKEEKQTIETMQFIKDKFDVIIPGHGKAIDL